MGPISFLRVFWEMLAEGLCVDHPPVPQPHGMWGWGMEGWGMRGWGVQGWGLWGWRMQG